MNAIKDGTSLQKPLSVQLHDQGQGRAAHRNYQNAVGQGYSDMVFLHVRDDGYRNGTVVDAVQKRRHGVFADGPDKHKSPLPERHINYTPVEKGGLIAFVDMLSLFIDYCDRF